MKYLKACNISLNWVFFLQAALYGIAHPDSLREFHKTFDDQHRPRWTLEHMRKSSLQIKMSEGVKLSNLAHVDRITLKRKHWWSWWWLDTLNGPQCCSKAMVNENMNRINIKHLKHYSLETPKARHVRGLHNNVYQHFRLNWRQFEIKTQQIERNKPDI